MSPRVCWAVGAVALLLSLNAAVVLWSSLRAGSNYEERRREAIAAGLPLAMPKAVKQTALDELRLLHEAQGGFASRATTAMSLTEYEDAIEACRELHSETHAVSELKPSSSRLTVGDLRLLLRCTSLCASHIRHALASGESDHTVDELKALRRLISLFPILDTESAVMRFHMFSSYCRLSLAIARQTNSRDVIDLLVREANLLPKANFELAANNITAEALESIDESREEFMSTRQEFEADVVYTVSNSNAELDKERLAAIDMGLHMRGNWHYDRLALNIDKSGYEFARLKSLELDVELFSRALRVLLHAHTDRVSGKPWPSMALLESRGAAVTHPLTGDRFRWSQDKNVLSVNRSDPALALSEVIVPLVNPRANWLAEPVKQMEAGK